MQLVKTCTLDVPLALNLAAQSRGKLNYAHDSPILRTRSLRVSPCEPEVEWTPEQKRPAQRHVAKSNSSFGRYGPHLPGSSPSRK